VGDGQLLRSLKARLDAEEEKANSVQDALIAEVAIVQKFTLVTSDSNRRRSEEALGEGVMHPLSGARREISTMVTSEARRDILDVGCRHATVSSSFDMPIACKNA
jgi:hypothetical protein